MFHEVSWKPISFGFKRLKLNGYFTTSLSICRQNAILPIFPAVMLRPTSNASDSGFSLRHVAASASRRVFRDVDFAFL